MQLLATSPSPISHQIPHVAVGAMIALQLTLATLLCASTAAAENALPPITVEASGQVLEGKMVWADLLTSDVDKATEFYSAVFGWEVLRSADSGFVTALVGSSPVASISTYEEEVPEGAAIWIPSFSTENVDAAASRVISAQGTELAPAEDLPGRGRVAVFADPQGAVFALLRATGGDPPDGGPVTAGTWLWPELWAPDAKIATGFYGQVLKLNATVIKDNADVEHHVLGGADIARSTVIKNPLPGVEPNWLLYLFVEDLAASLAAVEKHGGNILLGPQEGEGNNDIAIISDPTGGVLALQQRGGSKQ
jgi:predicted enzyme related to lactoylglutathione lyase